MKDLTKCKPNIMSIIAKNILAIGLPKIHVVMLVAHWVNDDRMVDPSESVSSSGVVVLNKTGNLVSAKNIKSSPFLF